MSKDEIISLAEGKGFQMYATLGGTRLQFIDEFGINLIVDIDNLEFELLYLVPKSIFRFITPKCSPFNNEEHFKSMYRKFRKEVRECWGHLSWEV